MNSYCTTPEYGIETVSRNFKMPSMHYHNAYELYYLEAGNRDYFVEDKLFSVAPGEFVLIPPGMLHRTGGEYCVRTLVHFTPAFLERIFTEEIAQRLVKCFTHVKIVPTAAQKESCRSLLKRLANAESDMGFALVLGLLLDELAQCANQEIDEGQVGRIVAYINQNFASIENLEEIAEHFYISKYHLCRIFKNAMQVTIVEYLNQVKLKNARQLLELTDRDIGTVAEQCGYHSVAYFSNIFKKSTGHAPSEYRRIHKA